MKPKAAEQTRMKQQDFEALFSKYRRLVYRAAYSVAGNKRDAEDALQSLFLKLIDQGFSEDSVRDPAGYLYRAAANEARQMYRARERRTRSHTPTISRFSKTHKAIAAGRGGRARTTAVRDGATCRVASGHLAAVGRT